MDTKRSLEELFSGIENEANLKIEQLKGKIFNSPFPFSPFLFLLFLLNVFN